MGYSVYWGLHDWHGEWQETWPQLIEDAKLIIEAADVLVCGPTPEQFPRHYLNKQVDEDIDFYPPICEIEDGIWLNGLAEDGHEAFILRRSHRDDSCKTLFKPYDTIVGCILLRAYQLQPDLTVVCSDGNWEEDWADIRRLYSDLWSSETILRPPNLHGVEERPSDPKHPRAWLNKVRQEACITLQDGAAREPQVNGEQKQSSPQLELDPKETENISTWLSRCDTDPEHKACKPLSFTWSTLPGVDFRLIDVKRRCIVQAPLTPAFAALSYVWGGVKQPTLTFATEIALAQEGGLDLTASGLPNTINDAIVFCKSIGLEYLWVDALCIKQDSTKDLKLQMRRMRNIYASAKVTIVVATGDDANARLISGSNGMANCNSFSVQELADVVCSSSWNTRGWTYQELALSHHTVFCTSVGMYLVCLHNASDINGQTLRFSTKFINPGLLLNKPGFLLDPMQDHQLHHFLRAVERYSQRKLSYQKDALNAFQGIIQSYRTTIDNNENAFYYGLPTCAFDQVFCFRTAHHDPSTRRKDFPSWSWLGWSQPVRFDHDMIERVRTWNMIHPPVLKDSSTVWPKSIHWETAGLKKLWRPIEHNPYHRYGNEYGEWGFPSAIDAFHNEPAFSVAVSISGLRIAKEPAKLKESWGCYDIFPTKCTQMRPEPPPKIISVWDLMNQPMSKPHIPTEEEKQAPLVPAELQTIRKDAVHYAEDYHDSHQDCEAHIPLGSIWLDKAWRDARPKNCVMGFVALCGKKKKKSGWVIGRLMLTEKVVKKEVVWGRERVQTMDCKITKEAWLKAGSIVLDTRLL